MSDRDRLNKLLELTKRGIGGEADNAARLLQKLLKEKGLTLDELEQSQTLSKHEFRYGSMQEKKLLQQVVFAIIGARIHEGYWSVKGKPVLMFELTALEAVKVDIWFVHYKEHLKKEMEVFYEAFISAAHLYPNDGSAIQNPDNSSKEELLKAVRVGMLASNIEAPSPRQQLKKGGSNASS
jgi:hypothetical protein